MNYHTAIFHFYEELNDFLRKGKKKKAFPYKFMDKPGVKDAIESLGVPHTEVDLIVVNGQSKKFNYHLRDNDRIAVYPMRLRKQPLRKPKFILDVHLGKLMRYLRLLGFDVAYRNDYADRTIVDIAVNERRTVLTRDIGLLKNKKVTRGYWLRNTQPSRQVTEVLNRFNLFSLLRPFSRCLECNGKIVVVSKKSVLQQLPLRTKNYYDKFYRCKECKRVYWQGSHYQKLLTAVQHLAQRNS